MSTKTDTTTKNNPIPIKVNLSSVVGDIMINIVPIDIKKYNHLSIIHHPFIKKKRGFKTSLLKSVKSYASSGSMVLATRTNAPQITIPTPMLKSAKSAPDTENPVAKNA